MQNTSTNQIVAGLNHAFRHELEKLPSPRNNVKGTDVHRFQTDFMYALDDITRGSTPEVESGISAAKKVISEMRKANA